MISVKNDKFLISIVLALFILAIICCFTLYPLLSDNVFAEPVSSLCNTYFYENFSSSYAINWPADSGNSFDDLSNLPYTTPSGNWLDITDFSNFKISDNLYNYCIYFPCLSGTYSPLDSVTRNGVVYDRFMYVYAYGSSNSLTGDLFQYEILRNNSIWYICIRNYIDNIISVIETQAPYDASEAFKYFNFSFNSNITRITFRSNMSIKILNVGKSVNQLVYTAFQSKNPTFLTTATYDGAYNAGYEDAKAKYDNLSAYMPGGVEYQKIYDLGKLAGSSENYTFFGLISAVIDAPIKAFTGLFNFEIFGVNIKSFLLSLFTIALVIAIVKLFMGNGGSNG